MDEVFAIRQVCETYQANGKDLFWAFMDLEKAYDAIEQHGMWQMVCSYHLLCVYGVGGKVHSFYEIVGRVSGWKMM